MFCLHECLCTTCIQCQQRPEEGVRLSRIGVTYLVKVQIQGINHTHAKSQLFVALQPLAQARATHDWNHSPVSQTFLSSLQGVVRFPWTPFFDWCETRQLPWNPFRHLLFFTAAVSLISSLLSSADLVRKLEIFKVRNQLKENFAPH